LPPENHDPRAVSICKIIAAHCDQSGKIEYFKSGKKPHNLGRSEFFTDDEFIAVAEEIGVIVPLGAWVIQQACRDAATWPKHIGVAVNLSSLQFKGLTLIQTVVSALDAAGLSPLRLELEIASGQIANSASPTSKLPYCRSDPVLAMRVSVALFSMPVSSGPLGGLGTAAK
jgi:EAL domain-containing protein (putative c-di-GMP-specific phosphodiesterase class I)